MVVNPEGRYAPAVGLLETAALQLREHIDEGWTLYRRGVLESVCCLVRPGNEVRGCHELGAFSVSSAVISSVVSRALAEVLETQVLAVWLDTADGELDAVTVEVAVAYGEPLPPLAGRVRDRISGVLRELLGSSGRVWATNVRFADVFRRKERGE